MTYSETAKKITNKVWLSREQAECLAADIDAVIRVQAERIGELAELRAEALAQRNAFSVENTRLIKRIVQTERDNWERMEVRDALRDENARLREALKKCQKHAGLDDPNWHNLTGLAFAARCGLVDATAKSALSRQDTVTYQKPGSNCETCGSYPCDCATNGPTFASKTTVQEGDGTQCRHATYKVLCPVCLPIQATAQDTFTKEDHGCSTGDCPHEKQSECDEILGRDFPGDLK